MTEIGIEPSMAGALPDEKLGGNLLSRALVIALGYFLLARLGNSFVVPPENISIFWPPSGYLLGILILHRPRQWAVIIPLVAIADFTVSLQVGFHVPFAAYNTIINCTESLLGAYLVRRLLGSALTLNRTREVFGLFGICIPVIAFGATLGTLASRAGGQSLSTISFWRVWFMSDLVSIAQVTPVILAWAGLGNLRKAAKNWGQLIELLLLFAGLIILLISIFKMHAAGRVYMFPLPYLSLLFLFWAALRFNPAITATAVLTACGIALWYTIHDLGPFAIPSASASECSLLAQEFMVILSVPALALASAIGERRMTQRFLAESEMRYRAVSEELAKVNSQLAESNETLRDISLTDPLTGLRNRRFLAARMPEDIAHVERVQRDVATNKIARMKLNIDLLFLMVDLDLFKRVNDQYGHHAGDMVLQQVARILRNAARGSDTVARYGGEEFLVVARHTARTDAHILPERIRAAVEAHPFDIGKAEPIHCTCSLGFSVFPLLAQESGHFTWEQIIDLADQCLYAAKRNGRNAWVGVIPDIECLRTLQPPTSLQDISRLIKSQDLQVITSLKKDLVWDS